MTRRKKILTGGKTLENEISEMLATYQSQFNGNGICYLLMEPGMGNIEMEWQPYSGQKIIAGNSGNRHVLEFFFAENGFPDASSCNFKGNTFLQKYPFTRNLTETSRRYKETLKEFLIEATQNTDTVNSPE